MRGAPQLVDRRAVVVIRGGGEEAYSAVLPYPGFGLLGGLADLPQCGDPAALLVIRPEQVRSWKGTWLREKDFRCGCRGVNGSGVPGAIDA
ncbi:hypothetical protein ACQP1G_29045 [Nocardia sp. CA-107356]|uniref:hypothetical protein n=1 Tax=Nocardia sp. CA-107356 TaxID=3239972 RepID=UPI003D904C50